MSLDWALASRPPRDEQRQDVETLLGLEGYGVFYVMGGGKTKVVADAAQFLHRRGDIKGVLVVCPAQVKSVWDDQGLDVGELVKDLWPSTYNVVHSLAGDRAKTWSPFCVHDRDPLHWFVVSYEYIRQEHRLKEVAKRLRALGPFAVVVDESSNIKGHKSDQTRALFRVKKMAGCARVWELNGTPVDHSPLDMYTQGRLISDQVLGPEYTSFYQFRAKVAIMGGYLGKQVVQFQNLEWLQRRFAPWCVYRGKEHLGLPEKVDLPPLLVPLSARDWRLYKDMRDDAVADLRGAQSVAAHGAVKVMRLLQICNGHLGGLDAFDQIDNDHLPFEDEEDAPPTPVAATQTVGTAKRDAIVASLLELKAQEPNTKVIVWCAFRHQIVELAAALRAAGVTTHVLMGGQDKHQRRAVKAAFGPSRIDSPGFEVGVMQQQAGGLGLNFTAASYSLYGSNVWSLRYRLQTSDRIHRPPQTHVCRYRDAVATGPEGQKTVESHVRLALLRRENVASWMASAWVKALSDE